MIPCNIDIDVVYPLWVHELNNGLSSYVRVSVTSLYYIFYKLKQSLRKGSKNFQRISNWNWGILTNLTAAWLDWAKNYSYTFNPHLQKTIRKTDRISSWWMIFNSSQVTIKLNINEELSKNHHAENSLIVKADKLSL